MGYRTLQVLVLLLVSMVSFAQVTTTFVKTPTVSGGSPPSSLTFQYKSCTMGTSLASSDNMMISFAADSDGTYLVRAIGVTDNQYSYLDSCYITSNGNIGTKKTQTSAANMGTLGSWEIRDTLTIGTYTVRFKWHDAASVTAGIVVYRGPATPASSGDDTTTTNGGNATFTPTSSSGDSLLMAVNGVVDSPTPGDGVTLIGTVNYQSGSRGLHIYQKTSSGNSNIIVGFVPEHFNSDVVVIKKP